MAPVGQFGAALQGLLAAWLQGLSWAAQECPGAVANSGWLVVVLLVALSDFCVA